MTYKVLHPVYRPTSAKPTFSTQQKKSRNAATPQKMNGNGGGSYAENYKAASLVASPPPTSKDPMRLQRHSSKKRVPLPDSYHQKAAAVPPQKPSSSRGMRFNPTRNSHAPIWGGAKTSMGLRPASAHESYRLTRKPVPEYFQTLNIERTRKTQAVGSREIQADPTRAGVRTKSADTKRSIKKRVSPPLTTSFQPKASVKIIPDTKYISDPIAQHKERYHTEPRKHSVRTFKAQPTPEDTSHLKKAGSRPEGPHLTQTQKQATPLQGGGFFPETAKPGVKYHTTQRPADHSDVFRYRYAGKISSPNTLKERDMERKQFENTLRSSVQRDHAANKEEYMYYKTRRAATSLALTDFCYPDNIKEQQQ